MVSVRGPNKGTGIDLFKSNPKHSGLVYDKPGTGSDAKADKASGGTASAKWGMGRGPAMAGGAKSSSGGMTDSAEAASKPKMPRGGSDVGRTQQRRGSAKAAPGYGASSGSITTPSDSAKKASKERGDAYLKSSSTDYGVGSAVNAFANKKKK